jgi:Rieske 2Fe-2S family protein
VVTHATVLSREYYTADDVFEREIDRVFVAQWTFAAHVSELAEPGRFVVVEIATESVIVIRDRHGEIRAFFNVCRHRGYRLCAPSGTTSAHLTCPYHQWSYGLDGRLAHVPGWRDGDGIDYGDWGLRPVDVEVWHGLVFVHLGGAPIGPISAELDRHGASMIPAGLEHLRLADQDRYDVGANWKILLENYLECYHCRGSHPELCASMALDAMYTTTDQWSGQYLGGSTPLKADRATMSIDGSLLSTRLGEFADRPGEDSELGGGFVIVPLLTRIICHVDHVVVHVLRPVSTTVSRWETRWYVAESAIAGVDYDPAELTRVWRATNMQDIGLCERTQAGVTSRSFEPGPLHPTRESAVRSALDTYLELMAGDG